MLLEIKNFPLHQARLFQTQKYDFLPDHDVMLNGLMGGETMGSEVRQAYQHLNREALLNYLYLTNTRFKGRLTYTKKTNKFERILARFNNQTAAVTYLKLI